jgi:hypothetical protein
MRRSLGSLASGLEDAQLLKNRSQLRLWRRSKLATE